jgi:hypothetical protein
VLRVSKYPRIADSRDLTDLIKEAWLWLWLVNEGKRKRKKKPD